MPGRWPSRTTRDARAVIPPGTSSSSPERPSVSAAAAKLDPEALRAAERAACLRYRERQRQRGLTFRELTERAAIAHTGADERTLRRILWEEVERGTVDYLGATPRFRAERRPRPGDCRGAACAA